MTHVAELLRRHLKAIRPRPRMLPPGKIALIVLAVLRHDQRVADMAGGNNISATTVRRWGVGALGRWGVGALGRWGVGALGRWGDEIIGLLAAKASIWASSAEGSQSDARQRTRRVEHGVTHPKSWRILIKLRTDPAHDQHEHPRTAPPLTGYIKMVHAHRSSNTSPDR
ncbi:hypothetical protein [Streptomyces sp. NPDC097610]|uniref:hypothetical protein n=1 Tax=Streptomyces sp. NPDC097610 TaxID=3157227 RepID=UPI00333051A1